ncbi:MAG: ABC transporter permease, partial [Longimicrobiales bacterium]|nr:ABC transporter permease [Longimicrobiales bacterium]
MSGQRKDRREGRTGSLPPEIEAVIRSVLQSAGLSMTDGRDEVERELRAHFEDGLASGIGPAELVARFGDPTAAGRRIAGTRPGAQARSRGERSGVLATLGEWRTELARAARRLARAPGFSFIVVATLALGVGANTGIFTVLNAVILEDLPYPEPDRLVRIYEGSTENPQAYQYLRAPVVAEYREWSEIFESVASVYTYREIGADLTDGDQPVRVTTGRVSAGYFETLGVNAALGRTFRQEESFGPGEAASTNDLIAHVAILGHDLWRRQFGGDDGVIGRTIRLDDTPFEVIGVMPDGFTDPFGPPADLWIPQDLRSGGSNSFGNFYLSAIARLRPGVTLDQARERGTVLAGAWAEVQPEAEGHLPRIERLHDDVVGSTRARMLWILSAAGILVLFTACLNVANLLLARGLGMDRPLALKAALGAGRGRLVSGILAENGLLAVAGGMAGLGVAWVGLEGLAVIAPDALPGVVDVQMGARVFGFALAATVVALLAFGLA